MSNPKRAARAKAADDDPVWQSVLRAPVVDEPEPEGEREAIEEAKRDGRWYTQEEVSAMIAERRDEAVE